jgi:hypothetical protein
MSRKRILIISYYYPPCNDVSSNRIFEFSNSLSNDFDINVVTRHWSGNENSWSDKISSSKENEILIKQQNSNLKIHFLPYKCNSLLKSKSSKFTAINQLIKGNIDIDSDVYQFKDYINLFIENNNIDLILVSVAPLSLIKLSYEINKKYKIPYIVDFRDFENNFVLNQNLKKWFNIKPSFLFFIKNIYVQKFLRNAIAISSVNNEILNHFKSIKADKILILNGYNKDSFSKFSKSENLRNNHLELSIVGTLYPVQQYNIVLEGINLFFKNNPYAKVFCNFIGVNSIESVGLDIKNKIIFKNYNITNRLSQEEAYEYLEKSDILWYTGWIGWKGVFSAKIFEYLGSKRNILIAPSDKDVLDKLLIETNSGEVANTSEEVCGYLEKKYAEWEEKGYLQYLGFDDKVNTYSRDYQNSNLIKNIKKLI